MKKILCLVISLSLLLSTSMFMVYAENGSEKHKNANDRNIHDEDKISVSDDVYKQHEENENGISVRDSVYKPNGEVNKNKSDAILDLKEQFREFHKDKIIRREILKQLVDLRRQNNDKSNPLFINGSLVDTDVPPVVKSGRTLIPLRAVSNSLGAKVEWDQKTTTVTITKDKTVIIIKLGSTVATVNGQEVKIDVSAALISNRTMVPIRFIAEIFNKNVDWDQDTGSVIIEDKDEDASTTPSTTPEVTQTPAPTEASSQEATATPIPSQNITPTTVLTSTPEPTPQSN